MSKPMSRPQGMEGGQGGGQILFPDGSHVRTFFTATGDGRGIAQDGGVTGQFSGLVGTDPADGQPISYFIIVAPVPKRRPPGA